MSSNDKPKSEILQISTNKETTERPASSENDMSSEALTPKKSPDPKSESQKSLDPETGSTGSLDSETKSNGSQRSLPQRLLTWTREDLFDFNPHYAKSLRGILNLSHIVFSMFVMSLVGSACYTYQENAAGFYCRTSGTFTFVIACSSFIQSVIFYACCLLSKEGEKRILTTSYEVVYYVTYALFFFLASLVISTSVSSRDSEGNYHVNLGGGVFGFFTTIAYTCSAVWFSIYHRKYAKKREEDEENS